MECYNKIRIANNAKLLINYPEGIEVNCGKCLNCLANRARDKAIRVLHESETKKEDGSKKYKIHFLTFTYDDNNENIKLITNEKGILSLRKDLIRKIRNKYLHINFDILQKIIDLNVINFTSEDNKNVILIENRKEDMILNEIYENKIMESFIISKANDNNLVNNICNESTYYFGIDDDYIKNLNVRKIQIENKLISYIDDEMKDKTLDYLCVWGMIV